MTRKLQLICLALIMFTAGIFLLAEALVFCAEPTTLSMERINKANQQRLAEQPALNSNQSLAQLCNDK